jgi:hypothetical protein
VVRGQISRHAPSSAVMVGAAWLVHGERQSARRTNVRREPDIASRRPMYEPGAKHDESEHIHSEQWFWESGRVYAGRRSLPVTYGPTTAGDFVVYGLNGTQPKQPLPPGLSVLPVTPPNAINFDYTAAGALKLQFQVPGAAATAKPTALSALKKRPDPHACRQ